MYILVMESKNASMKLLGKSSLHSRSSTIVRLKGYILGIVQDVAVSMGYFAPGSEVLHMRYIVRCSNHNVKLGPKHHRLHPGLKMPLRRTNPML